MRITCTCTPLCALPQILLRADLSRCCWLLKQACTGRTPTAALTNSCCYTAVHLSAHHGCLLPVQAGIHGTHTHTHTHMHARMHTHTHMHARTHAHTHCLCYVLALPCPTGYRQLLPNYVYVLSLTGNTLVLVFEVDEPTLPHLLWALPRVTAHNHARPCEYMTRSAHHENHMYMYTSICSTTDPVEGRPVCC